MLKNIILCLTNIMRGYIIQLEIDNIYMKGECLCKLRKSIMYIYRKKL